MLKKLSKRQKWACGIGGGLLVLYLVFGVILYGAIGERMARKKALSHLQRVTGQKVSISEIDIGLGNATLKNVIIGAPDAPLLKIDHAAISFSYFRSLVGSVKVNTGSITGWELQLREGEGTSNFETLKSRLRQQESKPGKKSTLMPQTITLSKGLISYVNDDNGVVLSANDVEGTYTKGAGASLHLPLFVGEGPLGSSVELKNASLSASRKGATIVLQGGTIDLWKGMQLSAIDGQASITPEKKLAINFDGSFGGASEKLWQAKGQGDLRLQQGSVDVTASSFHLSRIKDFIADAMFVDVDETVLGAALKVDFSKSVVAAQGNISVENANINHPRLASRTLREVSLSGVIDTTYSFAEKKAVIKKAELSSKGVALRITGEYQKAGGVREGVPAENDFLTANMKVPTVPCADVKKAIPKAMIPQLSRYKLTGDFSSNINLEVDWGNLEALKLDGSVGIRNCKVRNTGSTKVINISKQFVHTVEVEKDKWKRILIGPDNPNYYPLQSISPHLRNSLITTEDSRFYRHRGFIVSEFRTALLKNLKAGRFKWGASSITMQMVKNVFLYRQKTLSRKLQELFLTWHVETAIEKDRIFEVYLNAVEFGPNVYGIGPAASYYFGKTAGELSPRESAYISSIMPNPKKRSRSFCTGEVSKWQKGKIERILRTMVRRGRLTEQQLVPALNSVLVFNRDPQDETACLAKIQKLMANQRQTSEEAPKRTKRVSVRRVEGLHPPRPPLPEVPLDALPEVLAPAADGDVPNDAIATEDDDAAQQPAIAPPSVQSSVPKEPLDSAVDPL